jgi:hypothetical protein
VVCVCFQQHEEENSSTPTIDWVTINLPPLLCIEMIELMSNASNVIIFNTWANLIDVFISSETT